MFNAQFWGVLIEADTFWRQCVPFGLGAILCVFVAPIVWIKSKQLGRRRLRALWSDQRGAANAIEFTLVAPIFLVLFCTGLQMALLTRASLIVHYAAFAAARSALVHECNVAAALGDVFDAGFEAVDDAADDMGDLSIADIMEGGLTDFFGNIFDRLKDFSDSQIRKLIWVTCTQDNFKWEDAARIVLLTISPANYQRYAACVGGCGVPEDQIRRVMRASTWSDLEKAAVGKASYAFDPRNTIVELNWNLLSVLSDFRSNTPSALVATVSFRMPILLPVARFLATETEGGNSYRWLTSTVKLR